jgi:hypothetical protein
MTEHGNSFSWNRKYSDGENKQPLLEASYSSQKAYYWPKQWNFNGTDVKVLKLVL